MNKKLKLKPVLLVKAIMKKILVDDTTHVYAQTFELIISYMYFFSLLT